MKERKKSLRMLLFAGLMIPALTLACSMFVPLAAQSPAQPAQPTLGIQPAPSLEPIKLPEVVLDQQTALIALYQKVNPSVVNITIYGLQSGQVVPLGQGSGFVYDNEGHIVTNSHVVQEADEVEVTFSDGLIREGKVVGVDLDSDLAVVKVENMPAVAPLPLANMDEVLVGMSVVAIGNPFGLEGTLTLGIVSAVGRTIPSLTQFSIPKAIQTDAAINPGNSGGPLLNLKGEVIGVNAQIETGGTSRANSGVGFAIPVSLVERVVPSVIKDGKYSWPWLGVRGGNLTPAYIGAMNLPVERGAYIAEVIPGGPADKAGLKGATETTRFDGRNVEVGGDVVIAINGTPINNFDDLLIYVALETSPGDTVTLTVVRKGETIEVKVKLEPRPASLGE